MTDPEQLQNVDQEVSQRAQHYLAKRSMLERATEEEKATYRTKVLVKTLKAHAIFKEHDPLYDFSTLREVLYFSLHPETGDLVVGEKKISTWILPGRLATMSLCLIDMDGMIYGSIDRETNMQLRIENEEEFAEKDVIMLDYTLNQFISLHQHVVKDDDFRELFNEK